MRGPEKHYCIKEKESNSVQKFPVGKVPGTFLGLGGGGEYFLPA